MVTATTDKGRHKAQKPGYLDWGPSDSADDSESTEAKEPFEQTWKFFEDRLGMFQCQAWASEAQKNCLKNNVNGPTMISRVLGDESTTLTGTAISSLTREKQILYNQLFLAPRLQSMVANLNQRNQKEETKDDSGIPRKILQEPQYLSDTDTFISDEFTHMNQGVFNGVYDRMCGPMGRALRRNPNTLCTSLADELHEENSVLMSFDDTVSKLTLEDAHSLASASFTRHDHAKTDAYTRTVRRPVVSKDGLSRIGAEGAIDEKTEKVVIVHHISEPPNVERVDFEADFGSDLTPKDVESSKPPKRLESLRKKLVRSLKKLAKKEKCVALPLLPPTPPRPGTMAPKEDEEPSSLNSKSEQTDPCSTTTSFGDSSTVLHPEEEQIFVQTGDHVEEVCVMNFREEKKPQPPRPRRFKKAVGEIDQQESYVDLAQVERLIYQHIDARANQDPVHLEGMKIHLSPRVLISGSKSKASSAQPNVMEELEILPARKEPVYTSYVRTPSNKVVEDVEVLRKESVLSSADLSLDLFLNSFVDDDDDDDENTPYDNALEEDEIFDRGCGISVNDLSTLKINPKYKRASFEALDSTLSPLEEEPADVDGSWRIQVSGEEWWMDEKEVPPPAELKDMMDDNHTCSTMTPSLASLETMTARLEQERKETEELRLLLQKKDQDLERLRQEIAKFEYIKQ